jgi:hypothetical protein
MYKIFNINARIKLLILNLNKIKNIGKEKIQIRIVGIAIDLINEFYE